MQPVGSPPTLYHRLRLRFAPLLRWKTPGGVEADFEQIIRFEGGRPLRPNMAGNYVLADRTGRLYAVTVPDILFEVSSYSELLFSHDKSLGMDHDYM